MSKINATPPIMFGRTTRQNALLGVVLALGGAAGCGLGKHTPVKDNTTVTFVKEKDGSSRKIKTVQPPTENDRKVHFYSQTATHFLMGIATTLVGIGAITSIFKPAEE